MKIDWSVWKPRLAYGAFAVLAFVLSLRWTFPREAVKERLILELGARGWQIEAGSVGPGGIVGVRADDVVLEDAAGLKIPLQSVTASLDVFPLLTGKRRLAFDARVFQGRVTGKADLSGEERAVHMTISGVELAAASPLKRAASADLAGTVAGTVALVLPAAPNGKPTGRIDLTVADAAVNGARVPLPNGMGEIPIQKVSLGAVTAAVKLDAGKAVAEKLEAKGGDAEITGDGLTVTLQTKLEFSPVFGNAKVRLQPAFWQRSGMAPFQSLADAAKGADGAYALQVLGSVGHPRVSLAPNPR